MVKPLQKFDFRSSPYARPDKPWVCGYAAEGKPCQIGPDQKGGCRATAECTPTKSGDRWNCTRSQFFGGPCKSGPNADGSCCKPIVRCQPVKSWRAKRGTVVRWAVGLTIGILLVVFAGPGSLRFLSPGELSRAHATLTQCSSCHTSVDGGFTQWVASVIGDYDHDKDSQQCQSCHDLGENALAAHSLGRDDIDSLSASATVNSSASPTIKFATKMLDGSIKTGNNITCSGCHQEHLGSNNDLEMLDDKVCVVCHQNQFNSLNDGHPAFSEFPNNRRTHLNFDHVSHINKHFQEDENLENAPGACLDCHITQIGGGKMVTRSFEETCDICHGIQVEGDARASAKGIAVFGLPGLDVETLAEREISIGEWPEYAEDELSPYMRLLLSSAPGFSETEEAIAELDLLDLTDADDEQLSSVKSLVWIVKEFFYDLEVGGSAIISERLAGLSENKPDKQQNRGILASLPPDLLENARLRWFPSLLREIPQFRAGIEVPSPLSAAEANTEVQDEEDSAAAEDDEFDALFGDEESADGPDDEASEFDDLFGEDEQASESADKKDGQTESEFDALFGEDEEATEPEASVDSQTESEFDELFGEGEEDAIAEDALEPEVAESEPEADTASEPAAVPETEVSTVADEVQNVEAMTLKPEIEPATEPVAEVATLMPQSESINISITSASTSDIYQVGEEIFLTIKSDASGFVNCYLEGKDGFMRIFPNRFTPDGFVSSEGAVTLPDSTGYSITADLDGETIHCIVTTRSVYTELPGALKLADFEMLSISSKSEIIDAYEKVTAGHYGEASYTIRLQ